MDGDLLNFDDDIRQQSPLHCACEYSSLNIIKHLIENGGDIYYSSKKNSRDSLYYVTTIRDDKLPQTNDIITYIKQLKGIITDIDDNKPKSEMEIHSSDLSKFENS